MTEKTSMLRVPSKECVGIEIVKSCEFVTNGVWKLKLATDNLNKPVAVSVCIFRHR
jgi:hypothetical protein